MPRKKSQPRGGAIFGKGVDTQAAELRVTPLEKKVLALWNKGKGRSYAEIADELFGGKMTRQAVHQLRLRTERKLYRNNSLGRYKSNPGDCPLADAPLPARTRNALAENGYTRLGELAGISNTELEKIGGLGKFGTYQLRKLLETAGVHKVATFCPNCGAIVGAQNTKSGKKISKNCRRCGVSFEVKVKVEPKESEKEKAQAVAA